MLSNLNPETSKGAQCSICSKKFSRSDHLRRHQRRHSGIRPYTCIFCNVSFTRSDNLREHYSTCSQRDQRPIPEGERGGRRSHACDSCTSMKLGCDGNIPCKTCVKKQIDCRYNKLQMKRQPHQADALKSWTGGNQSSDRGSIKFLLNFGTASFIECFRFPSSNERRNMFDISTTAHEASEANVLTTTGNSSEYNCNFSDIFEDNSIDWSLFQDETLLRFFSNPLSYMQNQSDDTFTPMFMDPLLSSFDQATSSIQEEWEPPSVQSAAVVQAMLDQACLLQVNSQELAHVSQLINYLFTPTRIENLTKLYFEFWHPHCPVLHKPSFRVETEPIPLLISITMMGAMYSPVDREVNTAKLLLDVAELYIYGIEDLTDEFEIKQMLRASYAKSPEQSAAQSLLVFQHLQSAYLMVCVQFWAGNMMARRRAIETRFGVVVKIARKLGLTKAKHSIEDSLDEYSWIQKETRIRTINIMTLLDCAFTFFANFPCRLAVSEMMFDLPCAEPIWGAAHPFMEQNFDRSRHVTAYEAFQSLFKDQSPLSGTDNRKRSKNRLEPNPLNLNAMDMFILIHLLYVYTHTHITVFSATLPRSPERITACTPSEPLICSSDSHIDLIRTALTCWRSLWTTVRAHIPNHTWTTLGFFRNGYNYWLVTQLLINNKSSVDVMMGMEVNCEDPLKQLKGLLRDGGGKI